jgi:hypothetical protein
MYSSEITKVAEDLIENGSLNNTEIARELSPLICIEYIFDLTC